MLPNFQIHRMKPACKMKTGKNARVLHLALLTLALFPACVRIHAALPPDPMPHDVSIDVPDDTSRMDEGRPALYRIHMRLCAWSFANASCGSVDFRDLDWNRDLKIPDALQCIPKIVDWSTNVTVQLGLHGTDLRSHSDSLPR